MGFINQLINNWGTPSCRVLFSFCQPSRMKIHIAIRNFTCFHNCLIIVNWYANIKHMGFNYSTGFDLTVKNWYLTLFNHQKIQGNPPKNRGGKQQTCGSIGRLIVLPRCKENYYAPKLYTISILRSLAL